MPNSQTRPRSLRPRSTSITCSARSFSLRFSSSASRRSSSSFVAARARAGDRMRLDAPPFDAHQHLRRRPDDRQAAHADEIHVGRRVHVPQRAVDRERIGRDVRLEALRQHRLVDVAGGDVLLDRAHAGFERLARLVRPHVGRRARRLFRLRQAALELALEELDLGARELVERLEVLVRRDARVGDDQDAVLDVIERQHRVEQHEPGIVFGPLSARPLARPTTPAAGPARTSARRRSR